MEDLTNNKVHSRSVEVVPGIVHHKHLAVNLQRMGGRG